MCQAVKFIADPPYFRVATTLRLIATTIDAAIIALFCRFRHRSNICNVRTADGSYKVLCVETGMQSNHLSCFINTDKTVQAERENRLESRLYFTSPRRMLQHFRTRARRPSWRSRSSLPRCRECTTGILSRFCRYEGRSRGIEILAYAGELTSISMRTICKLS